MNLWIVIAILGQIAETIGPLPYDMAECQERVAEKSAELDGTFAKLTDADRARVAIDGRMVVRADVTIACVESQARPIAEAPS